MIGEDKELPSFEETQVMYTRAQGLQLLESFRADASAGDLFGQPVALQMKALVRLGSHRAPSAEDLAEFSRCCPFAQAEPGDDDRSFYLVGLSRDDGSEIDEAARALRLVNLVFKFLVGLGIAAEALPTWRQVSLAPHAIGLRRADDSVLDLDFVQKPLVYANSRALHAGDLWGALQTMTAMGRHGWPQRFIEVYQRGCELMVAPVAPLSTFHEEAYLCFFKCLEYIVMGKILDRTGQFNDRHFQAACEVLGAAPSTPDAPQAAAIQLISTRGAAVAHMTKKHTVPTLQPQDLAHLKSHLDLLCRVFLRRYPRPS